MDQNRRRSYWTMKHTRDEEMTLKPLRINCGWNCGEIERKALVWNQPIDERILPTSDRVFSRSIGFQLARSFKFFVLFSVQAFVAKKILKNRRLQSPRTTYSPMSCFSRFLLVSFLSSSSFFYTRKSSLRLAHRSCNGRLLCNYTNYTCCRPEPSHSRTFRTVNLKGKTFRAPLRRDAT